MIFKFRIITLCLFFIAVLEFGIFRPDFFLAIITFLFLFGIISGRKLGGRWIFSSLPAIFSISATGIFFLASSFWQRQIILLISASFLYLIFLGIFRIREYASDQTGRAMIAAGTAAAIFFAFSSSYGIYLNFLVPLWILMLVYFLITIFLSFQYLALIKEDRVKIWTYSLILSLIMMEIIWTQSFWPFGYLTTGVISLILYYVLWDLTQGYFLNLLSRKRVAANLIILSLATIMVLLSAKWLPIF